MVWCGSLGVLPAVSCVCVRRATVVSSCSDTRPAIWVACLLLSHRALHLLTIAFQLMRFRHTDSACSRCTPINPSSGGVSHLQILILLFSFPCSRSFGSPRYRSIAMLLTSGGGCCDPNVCPDVWPLSCLLCLSCAGAPHLVLLSTLSFPLIELLVLSGFALLLEQLRLPL